MESQKKIISYEFKITNHQLEDLIFSLVQDRACVHGLTDDAEFDAEVERTVSEIVDEFGLHNAIVFEGDPNLHRFDELSRINLTTDVLVAMVQSRVKWV